MFKKIASHLGAWVKIRINIYLPLFRSKNIIINGKIILNYKSFIFIGSNSKLVINGNIYIRNSKIFIDNSVIEFNSDVNIEKSIMSINNSTFKISANSKFDNSWLYVNDKSTVVIHSYFLAISIYPHRCIINIKNAQFTAMENCRIEGNIDCKNSRFFMDKNSFINYGTVVRCHKQIEIGKNVFISYECLIFDTNAHSLDPSKRQREIENGFPNGSLQTKELEPDLKEIKISDNAWIGMRGVIMKGVTIGENSVVGTASVVTKDVPANKIAAGNPALIKELKY
jgi:acetyltransferase-like isoleucine patch superfamily enzyme